MLRLNKFWNSVSTLDKIMALFSSHTSMVQRSKGQNAIAAAAYNARSKLTLWKQEEYGNEVAKLSWDYSDKEGLSYSKIHAPLYAMEWAHDRELLWNEAEAAEMRIDGQAARKIMLALPRELSLEQNIELLERFTAKFVELGMIVDVNMHMDKPENPHAHLMLTTRELVQNKYGEYKFSKVKNRDWGKPAFVNWHRELWAELINAYLYKYGFEERVTHRSYKQLGLDINPAKHEGPARNITCSELRKLNQEITLANYKKIEEKPSIILDKLATNRPVFTKDDIAKELDKILFAGAKFEQVSTKKQAKLDTIFDTDFANKYMQLYTRIMTSQELALVTHKDLQGRALYTTSKRLELEQRYIDNVKTLQSRRGHALSIDIVDLERQTYTEHIRESVFGIARKLSEDLYRKMGIKFALLNFQERQKLSNEQACVVIDILKGRDISVLEGIPGAGKTTIMREIVRQYTRRGYKVIGVAQSSAAALQLAKEADIESKNASLWRKEWLEAENKEFELILKGDYYKEGKYKEISNLPHGDDRDSASSPLLTNKHIMIIDEASMGELATMDYLLSNVRKARAKVILVGDNNQLSAVGFAGALKKTISICGSSKLEESRRQMSIEHRRATKLFSTYQVEEALDIYRREGSIVIDSDTRCSDRHLVSDYIDDYLLKATLLCNDNLAVDRQLVICTYTNAQSDKFNRLVREQLKEAGVLKGKTTNVAIGNKTIELEIGEQIVFTRNLNQLGKSGVFNGEVGTIVEINKVGRNGSALISVLVSKANGKKEGVIIDTSKYPQKAIFNYGYSVTAHKLQGATVDSAYIAHEKQMGFETINVLFTRHRNQVRLYTSHDILPAYIAQDRLAKEELDKATVDILIGLSSRRTNNSMAVDYTSIGLSREDQLLQEYIEHSRRSSELISKIAVEQAHLSKLKQMPIEVYEHELWNDFKTVKDTRDKLAGLIIGNCAQYSERLQQLGINHHTLLRHARLRGDARAGYSNTEIRNPYEQNIKSDINNKYTLLLDAINDNNSIATKRLYNDIQESITDIHCKLEQYCADVAEIQEEKSALEDTIYAEHNFRDKLMPSFISRIYKYGACLVLEKWDNLVENNGLEQAAKIVEKRPQCLGEVRGRGFGMFVALDKERSSALIHYKNLSKQLKAYSTSRNIQEEMMRKMQEKGFTHQLQQFKKAIETLKMQLPTELQEIFLQEVAIQVGAYYGERQCDIAMLKESELYSAVMIDSSKYSKAAPALIVSTNKKYHNANVAKAYQNYQQQHKELQPRLEFTDIKAHLNNSVIEQIFTDHATMINPDGKFKRNNHQLSCGSLNINLHNGLWYRFSDSSRGDIFTLVAEARGISKQEALLVVANYCSIEADLGAARAISDERKDRRLINQTDQLQERDAQDPWKVTDISTLSDKSDLNPVKALGYLSKKADIEHVYTYKTASNNVLGVTIRIRDHVTHKKQILPVAYCYNTELNEYSWRLKGFTDKGNKPIYGLEKLLQNPVTRPVLIVEGEKTADKAEELLPNYIVISWMGGSSSCSRVDWSSLQGREVIIWPDNDKPGTAAARVIKEHIDSANGFVGLCSIVDTKHMNLPEKWDLADSLPDHLKEMSIMSVLENTKQQNLARAIAESLVTNVKTSHSWRQALSSLDLLIAKGRVDDEVYSDYGVTNKELYKDTLAVMATNKGLDLYDKENYLDNIRYLQQEYNTFVQKCEVPQEAYSEFRDSSSFAAKRAAQLLKEVSVYHQSLLQTNTLTPVHQKHLFDSWKDCITQCSSNGTVDVTEAARKLYDQINSTMWQDQLEDKNYALLQCAIAKLDMHNLEEIWDHLANQQKVYNRLSIEKTEYADHYNNHNILPELRQMTSHALAHGVLSEQQLLAKLQTCCDLYKMHHSIKEQCYDYHAAKVHHNINELLHNPDKALCIGSNKFICPIEYLKHEIAHPSHTYVDTARLTKRLLQLEKQMQPQICYNIKSTSKELI